MDALASGQLDSTEAAALAESERPAALDHSSKFGCRTGADFHVRSTSVCVSVIERCRRAGSAAAVWVSRAAAVTYHREAAVDS
jgi:hypothetical protein